MLSLDKGIQLAQPSPGIRPALWEVQRCNSIIDKDSDVSLPLFAGKSLKDKASAKRSYARDVEEAARNSVNSDLGGQRVVFPQSEGSENGDEVVVCPQRRRDPNSP